MFILIKTSCWGMTQTSEGEVWVTPDGTPCPVRIQTHGTGKFGSGENRLFSDEYPEVWKVEVRNGGIENIVRFHFKDCPEGKAVFTELAPEAVQKAGRFWSEASRCYHCRCLERHLQELTEAMAASASVSSGE